MAGIDVSTINCSVIDILNNGTKQVAQEADDNIFAAKMRKAGMDKFADFLRDDWSAKVARKAGFNDFANWLDNKSEEGKELNDQGFFSNLAREAIKHPVVTITTVATALLLGKKLVKTLNYSKSENTLEVAKKVSTNTTKGVTTSATAASVVSTISKQKLEPSQLREIIDEGLAYEQKIGFSNLEIFKDVSPDAQRKIMNHFGYPFHQERLLSFASGATPGLLEKPCLDDIFDVLRSGSVKVIEAFDDKAGVLILNKKSAEEIIKANKMLFARRLGLADTSTVEEIFSIISKSSSSPLASAKKYSDLKMLLTGGLKKNATFSQILQDIANAEKHEYFNVGFVSFYQKSASGLDGFKQALIDNLNSSRSSYATMPQSFKDEVLKMIDSITSEEYARRLGDPIKFFQDGAYKEQSYEVMQKLATKLEQAYKTGSSISMQ